MTTKARKLAQRLSNGGTFTVRITKRDATERQMRFEVQPHAPIRFSGADRAPMVRVFDLDKTAYRTLRLDAVHQLTELKETARRTFDDIKEELHALMF